MLPALQTTLANLNTPYVDLYLIHWPFAYKEGPENFPRGPDGKIIISNVDYLETWDAMERLVIKGLAKSIGLSNFNKAQTERLLRHCEIRPVVNQIECHPYLTQQKLADYSETVGIIITAYSPLGSPARPWVTKDEPSLLEEPNVGTRDTLDELEKLINIHCLLSHTQLIAIAKQYNKTVAQVLIRYQLQRGHIVIPKSVTKSRIQSNFEVYDFSLSPDDMKTINAMDCDKRFCAMTG